MAHASRLSHVSQSSYFDPNASPVGFKLGDYVRVEFDWAGFKGKELVGEVTRVSKPFSSGVYNMDIVIPADAAVRPGETICVPAEYCKFLGFPVAVDDPVDEWINQAYRECYVTEVKAKGTRLRMEWEMPKRGTQGGWRTGTRVPGYTQLFYPCGQQRRAPESFHYTGEALDAFIRSRTGFESLEDMVSGKGGYTPTIRVDMEPGFLQLADAYDQEQIRRGDPRRAYRG